MSFQQEYDLAIVGGGAAGAILAARLSEDPGRRVLLLEAGADTPPGKVPADIRNEFPVAYSNSAYFWPGLKATAGLGQGSMAFQQARIMGGGSSVMGMWALRGMPSDYDAWRDAGAVGWSWEDVLPFFNKLERDLDYAGELHGSDGPIVVRRHASHVWPGFVRHLANAAGRAGLPLREDINADFNDGVFPVPVTNNATGRVSSATGYLTPQVRRRPNLTIRAEAEVLRVVFVGKCVEGLEVLSQGRVETVGCQEVVIAAGAIGSPTLLLRSGVGPAQELHSTGVEPVANVPGVGERLQNHCVLNLVTRIERSARQDKQLNSYGMACARLSSNHADGRPGDLHLQFVTKTSLNPHGDRLGVVGAALYSPLSRGKVSLASNDPSAAPRIEFRLLQHPSDRQRMSSVVNTAMDLLADPTLRQLRGDVFAILPSSMVRRLNRPGLVNYSLSSLLAMALDGPGPMSRMIMEHAGKRVSEADFARGPDDKLLGNVTPIFHPTSTCAMGGDDDGLAVVDVDCRVRGVEGLSIADASIMPTVPTGNTCLPAMMVAERAAHIIAKRGKSYAG
jgi:5-(hydroxymethyl)furfural/furfural oxidase